MIQQRTCYNVHLINKHNVMTISSISRGYGSVVVVVVNDTLIQYAC